MRNPESVIENETQKLLWDFKTQTDHLILARRLEIVINKQRKTQKKKKNIPNCGFCCPG